MYFDLQILTTRVEEKHVSFIYWIVSVICSAVVYVCSVVSGTTYSVEAEAFIVLISTENKSFKDVNLLPFATVSEKQPRKGQKSNHDMDRSSTTR